MIGRVLFWFKDGEKDLQEINQYFFKISCLLERLIKKNYKDSVVFKFINIEFLSSKTFEIFPKIPFEESYLYNGHLKFYGHIDFSEFFKLKNSEKEILIWMKCYEYLTKTASKIENEALKSAVTKAYDEGLRINLNPDFIVLENQFEYKNESFNIGIKFYFKENIIESKLVVIKNNNILISKTLEIVNNGFEFFINMYKSLEIENNTIIINVDEDVKSLPVKIDLPLLMKNLNA